MDFTMTSGYFPSFSRLVDSAIQAVAWLRHLLQKQFLLLLRDLAAPLHYHMGQAQPGAHGAILSFRKWEKHGENWGSYNGGTPIAGWFTLWLFNVAMENDQFIDDLWWFTY